MNASEIFDEALNKKYAAKRSKFLQLAEHIFSNETEESIRSKIELVKQRMNEGRNFSEICDDPDIFLGSIDREYVAWNIDHEGAVTGAGYGFGPMTLERWRSNHLYILAMNLL